jgi:hypothetical protein
MLTTFLVLMVSATVLSFHDTLYPLALVPLAIAGGLVALGLALERKG